MAGTGTWVGEVNRDLIGTMAAIWVGPRNVRTMTIQDNPHISDTTVIAIPQEVGLIFHRTPYQPSRVVRWKGFFSAKQITGSADKWFKVQIMKVKIGTWKMWVSNMAGFYFDDFGRQNMKKKLLGSPFVKSWGIIDEIANVIGFKPLFQKLTNNLT